MKTALYATLFISAALLAPAVQAETAQERCENIAEYAEGVAKLRDQGMRLKEVKEITAERAGSGMANAYNMASTMVYKNSQLSPATVRQGILSGCLSGLRK